MFYYFLVNVSYSTVVLLPIIFKEHATPGGSSAFNNNSKIEGEVVLKSIKRLYKRISKCSRESLSICGERKTQKRFIFIGKATTPVNSQSVFNNIARNSSHATFI